MSAAILTIGTELTRGEIVDANAAWLAERLAELGHEVRQIVSVPDEVTSIQTNLQRLCGDSSLVFCSGGLGPTSDDITAAALAAMAGVPLETDSGTLACIERRLTEFGRSMTESQRKQALVPRGSFALVNPRGMAAGFELQWSGATVYSLPGVPDEFRSMFLESIVPRLPKAPDGAPLQLMLRCFGLGESQINDTLAGIEAEYDVELGYRVTGPEVLVKVLSRGTDSVAKADRAITVVRSRLAEIVYGEGFESLAATVGQLALQRGWTVGCAESCTGGLVSQLITAEPGASDWFAGAVVCYAERIKQQLLGVDPMVLSRAGAVSEPTARAMAEGGRQRLGVDLCLAITGVAGPSGGTPEKPVGTVHFAVASPQGTQHEVHRFHGSRERIQRWSAIAGLSLVRRTLAAAKRD